MYYDDDIDCGHYNDYEENGYPGEFVYGDDHGPADDDYLDERWKRVDGWPMYWISDFGRVYGPGRYKKGQFLNPTLDRHGYYYVDFQSEGHRSRKYIHKLVAQAFVENDNGGPYVRHWNDVSTDNYSDNLLWGYPKDNSADVIRNGTAYCLKQSIPVRAIDICTGDEFVFKSQSEASRELGVHPTAIGRILKGVCNQTNGITFEYCDDNYERKRCNKRTRVTYGKVKAVNLQTGEECIFDTQKDAEEILGINNRMINRVLKGERRHTHNYSFEYILER